MRVDTTVIVNDEHDEDRVVFESGNNGTAYMKIEHLNKAGEWCIMGATPVLLHDMKRAIRILEATRDQGDC